jgi:SAM-dependent methyltransferase
MVFLSNYFKNNTPENSVILDAGCGNGNYVIDENRQKIAWAIGIDASQESTAKNICLR